MIIAVALAALALAAAACGDDDDGDTSPGPTAAGGTTPASEATIRVVTTVSPITSIAEGIGCEHIEIEGIIPEGVNSHTFEPAPTVAGTVSDADLIVLNGLFLEEPTLDLAEENKRDDAVILILGDQTISEAEWQYDFSFPESEGHPNPHLWPNPLYGLRYAQLIHDQLVAIDPGNAAGYDANLAAFDAQVGDMDARIMQAVETVPSGNRKLLTYHDSWPYWAPRYGFEVIGAVQPSDFAEPSAQEVAGLIDQIRDANLPAVFGSEVFPSDVLEQIADEAGAEFIDDLRDDDLPGGPGDADHTYLGLMLQNMRIMMPALGGNADAFDGFDPSLACAEPTRAEYPQ